MVKLAVDFSPKCKSVRNYFQNQVSVGTLLKVKAKWVHRGKPHGKNIIGGVIYRPPNQRVGDFVSKHNDLLALSLIHI